MMTYDEAIARIVEHKLHHGISHEFGNHFDLCTALDMGIDALEKMKEIKSDIRYNDSIEMSFDVAGFKMNGDQAVGLMTSDGFTIEMQDSEGNAMPLDVERIKGMLKEATDVG